MTKEQLKLIKHAIGYDTETPLYRNYYCASPGSPSDLDWQDLCQQDVARCVQCPNEMYPYNVYTVHVDKLTEIFRKEGTK